MSDTITYRLSGSLNDLLRPKALISAASIYQRSTEIPNTRGVYGWWFDKRLPGVPLEGTLINGDMRLMYVGIAPRAPSKSGSISKSTMRRRVLRDHLGNRIAKSTLRRSLAFLLAQELDLQITLNDRGKLVLPIEQETILTDWIVEHAGLSYVETPQPRLTENELISRGPALPLNIAGSAHPFSKWLSQLRSSAS